MRDNPTRTIDFHLDFDTGNFTLKIEREGGGTDERRGRFSRDKILEINSIAAKAAATGLETKACKSSRLKGELKFPILHAVMEMSMSLEGEIYHAPDRPDCWSVAAKRLSDATNLALEAVLMK